MARYGAHTKRTLDEVADLARKEFADHLGLTMGVRAGGTMTFTSPVGFVEVEVQPSDGHLSVDVITREFDDEVEHFLRDLA